MYGEELRKRKENLGLSTRYLGNCANISQMEISRIMNDKRNSISIDTFISLMDELKLNALEFPGFVHINIYDEREFTDPQLFITLIKDYKKKNKISNVAFGKLIGLSDSGVYKILNGQRRILTINTIYRICYTIGVDYELFINNSMIKPSINYDNRSYKL